MHCSISNMQLSGDLLNSGVAFYFRTIAATIIVRLFDARPNEQNTKLVAVLNSPWNTF